MKIKIAIISILMAAFYYSAAAISQNIMKTKPTPTLDYVVSINGTTTKTATFGGLTSTGTATATQFISTILAGTAPFTVISNTLVANLNSDLLDGLSEAVFFRLNENETVTGVPAFNGGTSGASAPFSVDSTFLVSNLNADTVDGYSYNALPYLSTSGGTVSGNIVANNITATSGYFFEGDGSHLTGISSTSNLQQVLVAGDSATKSISLTPTLSPALYVFDTGHSTASNTVTIITDNSNASANALSITNTGAGGSIYVTNTAASTGIVARYDQMNPANSQPVLTLYGKGTGNSIYAVSAGDATVLNAEITETSSVSHAVQGKTRGAGSAVVGHQEGDITIANCVTRGQCNAVYALKTDRTSGATYGSAVAAYNAKITTFGAITNPAPLYYGENHDATGPLLQLWSGATTQTKQFEIENDGDTLVLGALTVGANADATNKDLTVYTTATDTYLHYDAETGSFRLGACYASYCDTAHMKTGQFTAGDRAYNNGANTQSFGYSANCQGDYSTCMGNQAYTAAGENYMVAIGYQGTVRKSNSFAIGNQIEVSGDHSFGFGDSFTCTGNYSMCFGAHSSVPTLRISDAGGTTKSGNVGIGLGNTDATARLYVKNPLGADTQNIAEFASATGTMALITNLGDFQSVSAAIGGGYAGGSGIDLEADGDIQTTGMLGVGAAVSSSIQANIAATGTIKGMQIVKNGTAGMGFDVQISNAGNSDQLISGTSAGGGSLIELEGAEFFSVDTDAVVQAEGYKVGANAGIDQCLVVGANSICINKGVVIRYTAGGTTCGGSCP